MKNLYLMTMDMSVVFAHEDPDHYSELKEIGKEYLKEDLRNYSLDDRDRDISVNKVTLIEQIPHIWTDAPIYGVDHAIDITPRVFLDPEYQLYLKLKNKFEK